ncbi:MAG: tetratricopeptide repeat protein [bacterium]|nr:tetratricopeptide repeat protein [bacterium]
MKKLIYALSVIVALMLVFCSRIAQKDFTDLSGPYLGQKSPGNNPELFLPGLVSTNNLDICIAFLQEGNVCVFSNDVDEIYYTYVSDGSWTTPVKAPFPEGEGKIQYTAGPDGKTIYFYSSRLTSASDMRHDLNIWAMVWTGTGWAEPYPLPSPVNTEDNHELYPSKTQSGNLYFFSGWRKNNPLGDVYRSRFIKGEYQQQESLEDHISTEYHEIDPVIAPDESYIIFGSNRPGGYNFYDLYISFRIDSENWTHPVNLGEKINGMQVNTVCITRDGKYFFFSGNSSYDSSKGKKIESPLLERIGDIDIFWIETEFINDLKEDIISKTCAADIVFEELQKNGLQAATAKLDELYADKQNYYFSMFELLSICGGLIKSGEIDKADEFYHFLLSTFPGDLRIKQGYVTVCIMNQQVQKGITLLGEFWSRHPEKRSNFELEPLSSNLNFLKRIDDEILLLNFIITEFPDWPYGYYDIAQAYERNGNIQLAIENCRKALELKSGFEEASALLSNLENK